MSHLDISQTPGSATARERERAQVAIIGAGAAGFRCAESYRKGGGRGRVLLLGDEPHPPYDRPELSKKVLTGADEPSATHLTSAAALVELGIDFVPGARVTRLNLAAGTLEYVVDGPTPVEARFDRAVLATGGRPRVPAIDGTHLDGVVTLRTADDAVGLRARLAGRPRVVVVGAGFIGTEVAAVARAQGAEVTVLDPAPRPLMALPSMISDAVAAEHSARGVRFELGVGAAALLADGEKVRAVELTDGRAIEADLVVIGVGLVPNDELAAAAGVETDDGVLVDRDWRSTDSRLYAVGDVARSRTGFLGESTRHEHWRTAHTSGAAVGHLLATGEPSESVLPWFWTEQFDTTVHVAGSPRPDDEVIVRAGSSGASLASFHRRDGIWTAVVGLNDPLQVRVGQALVGTKADIEAALRAPGTNLRAAVAAALA